jgi:hypothetical protein
MWLPSAALDAPGPHGLHVAVEDQPAIAAVIGSAAGKLGHTAIEAQAAG